MPDEGILGERLDINYKQIKAKKIIDLISLRIKNIKNQLSQTNIPYFDINFHSIIKIMTKMNENEILELTQKKEIQIYHQQIEWFERIFGFSFPESHKFISKINNQSLYTINQLFPNLIELNNNNSFFKVDPIKVVSSKSGHLIPLKTSKETTLLSIEMLDKVHSLDKYEST